MACRNQGAHNSLNTRFQRTCVLDISEFQFRGGPGLRVVNEERLSNQVRVLHEPPIPAVQRIVAVIAQHEIVPCRNDQFAIHHMPQHLRPGRQQVRLTFHSDVPYAAGQVVPIHISRKPVNDVRLPERCAIQIDHAIFHSYPITRHANHSLDEDLLPVHRVMKHDQIASLGSRARNSAHQQVITNQKRVLHATRRHHVSPHEQKRHAGHRCERDPWPTRAGFCSGPAQRPSSEKEQQRKPRLEDRRQPRLPRRD